MDRMWYAQMLKPARNSGFPPMTNFVQLPAETWLDSARLRSKWKANSVPAKFRRAFVPVLP